MVWYLGGVHIINRTLRDRLPICIKDGVSSVRPSSHSIRSDDGLTLKTSAFGIVAVPNLAHRVTLNLLYLE